MTLVESSSHTEHFSPNTIRTESVRIWQSPQMELYLNEKNRMHEAVHRNYDKPGVRLIRSMFDLASVAHQRNEGADELRYRKTPDKDGNKVPYMTHIIAGSGLLAGVERYDTLETGALLHILQEPYHAEIITAFLLHDVVEDTKYSGVEKEAWYPVIDRYLKEAGGLSDESARNRIKCMVRAVTKYEKDELSTVEKTIRQSDLFNTIVSQLAEMSSNTEEIETDAIRAIADTYKIFTTVATDTNLKTHEDKFMAFFGAMIIKFHDNEDNLTTKGTKPASIIRRQLMSVLSRMFGFPIASRQAVRLASYTSIGDPEKSLQRQPEEWPVVEDYCNMTALGQKPGIRVNGSEVNHENVRVQLPIVTLQEKRGDGPGSLQLALQYQMKMDAETIERLNSMIRVNLGDHEYEAHEIDAKIHKFVRAGGRSLRYYQVVDTRNRTKAIFKIVDGKPWPNDLLGRMRPDISVEKVPEWELVKEFLDKAQKVETLADFLSDLNILHPATK